MRTVSPKKQGKMPAVDIFYGTPGRPKKVTIHLNQVTTTSSHCVELMEKFLQPGSCFCVSTVATIKVLSYKVNVLQKHYKSFMVGHGPKAR